GHPELVGLGLVDRGQTFGRTGEDLFEQQGEEGGDEREDGEHRHHRRVELAAGELAGLGAQPAHESFPVLPRNTCSRLLRAGRTTLGYMPAPARTLPIDDPSSVAPLRWSSARVTSKPAEPSAATA